MLRKMKWVMLGGLAGTTLLFGSGCLSAFRSGFSGGFPASDSTWGRVLNLAIDVTNEVVLG